MLSSVERPSSGWTEKEATKPQKMVSMMLQMPASKKMERDETKCMAEMEMGMETTEMQRTMVRKRETLV